MPRIIGDLDVTRQITPGPLTTAEQGSITPTPYSIVWNAGNQRFEYWDGAAWVPLVPSAVNDEVVLTAAVDVTSSVATALTITTPSAGVFMVYGTYAYFFDSADDDNAVGFQGQLYDATNAVLISTNDHEFDIESIGSSDDHDYHGSGVLLRRVTVTGPTTFEMRGVGLSGPSTARFEVQNNSTTFGYFQIG